MSIDTKNSTSHSSSGAMLAVKEERTVIGGIELARKTVVAATDEGVVTTEYVEARNINLPGR